MYTVMLKKSLNATMPNSVYNSLQIKFLRKIIFSFGKYPLYLTNSLIMTMVFKNIVFKFNYDISLSI